jgi:hypothetical protein
MKTLAALSVLSLIALASQLVFGQNFVSHLNGSWVVGTNWTGGTAPALGNPGGITTHSSHHITIGSDIFLNSDLSVAGSTTIIVSQGNTLTINGNITFQNNSIILVESGGVLVINGNVTNNNNSNDITVNGTIVINGNFTGGNGSEVIGIGNFEISGSITTSGSGSVFGSTENCTSNCSIIQSTPLPILLGAFSATLTPEGVLVSWTTETERDNYFFEVYHSINGSDWELLSTLPGAGNSSTPLNYSVLHTSALQGENYYQLYQQDFDGTRTFFAPTLITIQEKVTLIRRMNTAGQEVNENYKGLVIDHYSDGTSVKRMQH